MILHRKILSTKNALEMIKKVLLARNIQILRTKVNHGGGVRILAGSTRSRKMIMTLHDEGAGVGQRGDQGLRACQHEEVAVCQGGVRAGRHLRKASDNADDVNVLNYVCHDAFTCVP
mmetsp:Transcript_72332/g.117352  ORF Transcript_72332/g.117352 Transcript_72332/m.117352 type:complete len:117 (+) Transcript_72332:1256-1606(+)